MNDLDEAVPIGPRTKLVDIKLEASRDSEEEESPVKKKRKQSDRKESPVKKVNKVCK